MAFDSNPPQVWILWDARGWHDTEDAAVLTTANSYRGLRRDSLHFRGTGAIWAQYDLVAGVSDNERMLPDLHRDILGEKP